MNIKKIRDIFKRDREVSLHDLSLETGELETDLEYVLADWEARKRVETVKELPFCTSGGCSGCSTVSFCNTVTEKKYRWQAG